MSKYKKVYFRINTPSYYKNKYGIGFENIEEGNKFKEATLKLFTDNGWTIKEKKYSSGCTTVCKNKQELYLHPQAFSGVVLEENIEGIEQLLSACDLFKFERTDIYEDVFDITDEEYISTLESKKQEIENGILDKFKTKRRNLFITSTWTPLQNVLSEYKIARLTKYINVNTSSDIDYNWILGIFENLVKENRIITASTRNGMGYRTATKKDVV